MAEPERYKYVEDYSPPAPFGYISLAQPQEDGPVMEDVPAQIDSASDYTILPQSLIEQLRLVRLGQVSVMGFSGAVHTVPTYLVRLGLKNREPSLVRVLADPNESVPIVGRDVLNQFRIVLDGPNQVLIVE